MPAESQNTVYNSFHYETHETDDRRPRYFRASRVLRRSYSGANGVSIGDKGVWVVLNRIPADRHGADATLDGGLAAL
jgi:hypothetical protein